MSSSKHAPNQHSIWVTDDEWEAISNRANVHGMSKSRFLLTTARANNNQNAADGPLNNAEMRCLFEDVREMASRHRRLETPLVDVAREMSLDGMGGSLDLRGVVRALYLLEADKRRRRTTR